MIQNRFDNQWIQKVHDIYNNTIIRDIGSFHNTEYFRAPGKYSRSYNKAGEDKLQAEKRLAKENDYCRNMLYPTNISILQYIIEHNLQPTVLDYGAGVGLLSVFLAKLGIECINYDNLSQIGQDGYEVILNFLDQINRTFGYRIRYITDLNNCSHINMITVSGIFLDKLPPHLTNSKYLLLDIDSQMKRYLNREMANIFNAQYTSYIYGAVRVYKLNE